MRRSRPAAGRVNGFIYAGNITDPLLQKLGLKNIRREFYKSFDACAVLPKNGRGGPVDQWLVTAMAAANKDPAFNAAIEPLLSSNQGPEWQV